MTEVRAETSPSDEKLREYLLTDTDLERFEKMYPGKIRQLSVRRYEVRLEVDKLVLDFDLKKGDGDYRAFRVYLTQANRKRFSPELFALAKHRAAEALLALRKGHMEFRRNRKLRAEAA